MTKTILAALLALALTAPEASAQSRAYCDAAGKRIGSASTDSSGTVTNYYARGRVLSRESTSGNTATIYDRAGRVIGRTTTNK